MRNLSYMGRVVVKLIIIGIIAFVVITTAVFIINKYKGQNADRADQGSQIAEQEQKDASDKAAADKAATDKAQDKDQGVLPGAPEKPATAEKTENQQPATQQPVAQQPEQQTLPRTGPIDTGLRVAAVAILSFSVAIFYKSFRALA